MKFVAKLKFHGGNEEVAIDYTGRAVCAVDILMSRAMGILSSTDYRAAQIDKATRFRRDPVESVDFSGYLWPSTE